MTNLIDFTDALENDRCEKEKALNEMVADITGDLFSWTDKIILEEGEFDYAMDDLKVFMKGGLDVLEDPKQPISSKHFALCVIQEKILKIRHYIKILYPEEQKAGQE